MTDQAGPLSDQDSAWWPTGQLRSNSAHPTQKISPVCKLTTSFCRSHNLDFFRTISIPVSESIMNIKMRSLRRFNLSYEADAQI
jgi:hypothetical protein